MSQPQPGLVVLFGSGETSPSGRRIFDWLFQRLPQPPRVSILETPAGFEPNSHRVAGRIAEFLAHRLQNYDPQVDLVPARRRGTPFSPDKPDVVAPLYESDAIFLGPGSPTYAARQLNASLAWHIIRARHYLGTCLIMASAATIASSRYALPVYEIYKVGEDLAWREGLDLFGSYGLSLVIIPHWNNNDGGDELDTSRCYMGMDRFRRLSDMLPPGLTILGIDEHTALAVDPAVGDCHVLGRGSVTLTRGDGQVAFVHESSFGIDELGPFHLPDPDPAVPASVWSRAQMVKSDAGAMRPALSPPAAVLSFVAAREEARAHRDWQEADRLRDLIIAAGWEIRDTPNGPELVPQVKTSRLEVDEPYNREMSTQDGTGR